jgi:transposase
MSINIQRLLLIRQKGLNFIYNFNMQRVHLTTEQSNIAIRMHQRGYRQIEIAAVLGTTQSVISRTISRFRDTGSAERRPGSGSQRVTTPRQDRSLIINIRMCPFSTARHLQQDLFNATATLISDQTVRNRLREVGISSYRPLRSPARTPAHRRRRVYWARLRLEEVTPWDDILFSDESRFCLHNDSRRPRVYRNSGNRTLSQYVQPVVAFGGAGVMVWAGISMNFRTDLHIIDGSLTGQRYNDDIILGPVLNRANAIGRHNFILLDDNARPHRAQVVLNTFGDEEINHLPLPPLSPDLNPIEHVWDFLQRRLDNHHPHPTTRQELRDVLPVLWQQIPQEHINHCIASMPARCEAVIEAHGGATRF